MTTTSRSLEALGRDIDELDPSDPGKAMRFAVGIAAGVLLHGKSTLDNFAAVPDEQARAKLMLAWEAAHREAAPSFPPGRALKLYRQFEEDARFRPEASWNIDALLDEEPSEIRVLWGTDSKRVLASSGPTLLFGPDSAGKTTIASLVTAAAVGLRNEVLGWPVTPLPETEGVLYLALDRPEDVEDRHRSLKLLRHPRVTLIKRLPEGMPELLVARDNPDHLARLVARIEEHRGPIGLVVIDNLQRTFGPPSETSASAYGAKAVNELAPRYVLSVTQVPKRANRPTSHYDSLLAADGLSLYASSVSVYVTRPGADKVEARHHKGRGADSTEVLDVAINWATGAAEVVVDRKLSEAKPKSSYTETELGKAVLEVLPDDSSEALGSADIARAVFKVVDLDQSHRTRTNKALTSLVEEGAIGMRVDGEHRTAPRFYWRASAA